MKNACFGITLLLTLTSMLAACDNSLGGTASGGGGGSGGGGNGAPKVDITGTWACVDGPITTRYQFKAGGTITKTVSLPSNLPQQEPDTGTWQLNDDLSMDMKLGEGEERGQLRPSGSKMSIITSDNQVFYRI